MQYLQCLKDYISDTSQQLETSLDHSDEYSDMELRLIFRYQYLAVLNTVELYADPYEDPWKGTISALPRNIAFRLRKERACLGVSADDLLVVESTPHTLAGTLSVVGLSTLILFNLLGVESNK